MKSMTSFKIFIVVTWMFGALVFPVNADSGLILFGEQAKALIREKVGTPICTTDDLMSSEGGAGQYNRKLALLGAFSASDVYYGDGPHEDLDADTLKKEGFNKAMSNARVVYGEVAKGLEALTLEKRVAGKRIIAVVFEGTDNQNDLVPDWDTNLTGQSVRFPYWRNRSLDDTSAAQQKADLEERKLARLLSPLELEQSGIKLDYIALSNATDRVHLGFRTATWDYMMMEGEIVFSDGKTLFQLIKDARTDPNIRFLVFGHSMGGALATLYACELAERGGGNIRPSCYTYAASRCSYDGSLQGSFQGAVNYHSFVHPRDIIRLTDLVPGLDDLMQNVYYYRGNPANLYSTAKPFTLFRATWHHAHVLYVVRAFFDWQLDQNETIVDLRLSSILLEILEKLGTPSG